MVLLDGILTSSKIRQDLRIKTLDFFKKFKRVPHLCAIIVGNNPASQTYVNNKIKSCQKVGFESTVCKLSEKITEKELIKEINKINNNDKIDGLIVQLPLPNHINEKNITVAISPDKDVDGFHPNNIGKMFYGLSLILPATPMGIMKIFEYYNINTTGKKCVIIGRSNIVGKPISMLMSQNLKKGNSTVTICHSKTHNLKNETKSADIIIAAIGKPNFLKADMVKKGVVVIDVGINVVEKENRKTLCGDVDFENVKKKASYITPVPGGVGPMTVSSLLINTLSAAESRENKIK